MFAKWDETPLSERILVFGKLSPKGFITLSPEDVGPFVAPGNTLDGEESDLPTVLISLSDRQLDRSPTARGIFPTVYLPPSTSVGLTFNFPNDWEGRTVHLAAPGEGTLSTPKFVLTGTTMASVDLAVNEYEGSYPLELVSGKDRYTIDLWVGEIGAHLTQLVGGEVIPPSVAR